MDRINRLRAPSRTSLLKALSISEVRLAGYCSILLAAAMLLVAITYVLLPGHPTDANAILLLAGTSPGWFRFLYGVFALGGILGLFVVEPASRLVGDAAWMVWAKRLAYLGFALAVVQGLWLATVIPQLGVIYKGCLVCGAGLPTQFFVARTLYTILTMESNYLIIFGGVSLWTLVIGLISLAAGTLPRPLSYASLALTLAYWLLLLGVISGNNGFFTLMSIVTGVILGPAWYAWLGLLLTTRARDSKRRSGGAVPGP